MPKLARPDGVEIHYELAGDDGPPVVFAGYWNWSPGVFDELLADLAADHRVLTYDLRGTGQSTRSGPYDIETDVADLEALLEEMGGPALLVSVSDGANRAVRVAARRPDLVATVAALGSGPLSRRNFSGEDAMLASDAVVETFIEMLGRDYRAALRTIFTSTNEQMSEDDLRERVAAQASYCPMEAAVGRVRAWFDDDPDADAAAIGERLWMITAPTIAGAWLPEFDEVLRVVREKLPRANLEVFEEGFVSQPAEGAELIRRITAPLRS